MNQIDQDLWKAVSRRSVSRVRALLDQGADANARDKYGSRTVLMAAAARGDKDMVELLLDAGADINAVDSSGETALMHSLNYQGTEALHLLVARGADVNAKDKNGASVLRQAVRIRYVVIGTSSLSVLMFIWGQWRRTFDKNVRIIFWIDMAADLAQKIVQHKQLSDLMDFLKSAGAEA